MIYICGLYAPKIMKLPIIRGIGFFCNCKGFSNVKKVTFCDFQDIPMHLDLH